MDAEKELKALREHVQMVESILAVVIRALPDVTRQEILRAHGSVPRGSTAAAAQAMQRLGQAMR